MGDFYFPNVTPEEKQVHIKLLNLRLDFDASIRKWEREWQIPELASIMQRRCMVQLPGALTPFDFRAYVISLQQRTPWMDGATRTCYLWLISHDKCEPMVMNARK